MTTRESYSSIGVSGYEHHRLLLRSVVCVENCQSLHPYFFFAVVDEDLPGLSVVIVPLPNFCVLLLEPFVRFVIVPEPNV